MKNIFDYNRWLKNRIGILNMTPYKSQIISSMDLLNIPTLVFQYSESLKKEFDIAEKNICGFIISGGFIKKGEIPPNLPMNILNSSLPKLGICLGHEIFGTYLGSSLIPCNSPGGGEHGEVMIKLHKNVIFEGIETNIMETVKMEHDLMLDSVPPGSDIIASTHMTPVAGFHSETKNIWGLQFHPEKDWMGDIILKNFYNICLKNQYKN